MRADTRREVKQTARKLYRDGRISLEMAIWAMKNAGYTREETAEWLKLTGENRDERNNEKNYTALQGRELPRKQTRTEGE